MAKVISGTDFDGEVLKSDLPVMVDFFAAWCGPCRMIAPAVEELSSELSGKAKIVKLDIDETSAAAILRKYNITSVPTLMFFKSGKMIESISGAFPKNVMLDKLNKLI